MSLPLDRVPLPPALAVGVLRLVRRTLGLPPGLAGDEQAAAVLQAAAGPPPLRFGALAACTSARLQAALDRSGAGGWPVGAADELATLLPEITPAVPICSACGELPLARSGGATLSLPAPGALCPFCDRGTTEQVPVPLRKLAWTTAALVPPDQSVDRRAVAGRALPLDDQALVEWVSGAVDPELSDAAARAGLRLHELLAYLLHVRRACADAMEAPALLARPDRFGLQDRAALDGAARAAAAWLARAADAMTWRPARPLGGPTLRVAGRVYRVHGLLALGASCSVLRGRWAHRLGEEVVLKLTDANEDGDRVQAELQLLQELQQSTAQGADFFASLLPQPVALDATPAPDGRPRQVAVYRWRSGFHHTLADVRRVHPAGVAGPVAVWIYKRLLEFLGWLHRAGVVHGAVLPPHALIHPRDHGVVLVGFTCAARLDGSGQATLPALPRAWRGLYPPGVAPGTSALPALDLVMAARTVLTLLGGEPERGRPPQHLPGALRRLLAEQAASGAERRQSDAWEVLPRLAEAAQDAYGAPAHHPLPMPGW